MTRPSFFPSRYNEVDGMIFYNVSAETVRRFRESRPDHPEWAVESFNNHVHFSVRDGEEACLRDQYQDADEKERGLRSLFPERTFVLRLDPLSTDSFYQAQHGAPLSGDGEWEPNGPGSGGVLRQRLSESDVDPDTACAEVFDAYRDRRCPRCQTAWRYASDRTRDEFPGTRWSDCPACGLPQVVATQTIFRIVGPQ